MVRQASGGGNKTAARWGGGGGGVRVESAPLRRPENLELKGGDTTRHAECTKARGTAHWGLHLTINRALNYTRCESHLKKKSQNQQREKLTDLGASGASGLILDLPQDPRPRRCPSAPRALSCRPQPLTHILHPTFQQVLWAPSSKQIQDPTTHQPRAASPGYHLASICSQLPAVYSPQAASRVLLNHCRSFPWVHNT